MVLSTRIREIGYESVLDPKGNVLIRGDDHEPVRILVTAHMDEIALMVKRVAADGTVEVLPLGGIHAWKLGEGPVLMLGPNEELPGVLSFGSIHTEDPKSAARTATKQPLDWSMAHIFTGYSAAQLAAMGIGPGTRVVVSSERRRLFEFGHYVSGYFLDDRADLVAWLLCLKLMGSLPPGVAFAATTSEEVGGEGAKYALHKLQPEVCIALELGPAVPDAPVHISPEPTLWVTDSFAAISPADIQLVRSAAKRVGTSIQLQALSRGGSDASASAAQGLCARPITLGIPMANSHGFEIIHRDGMVTMARLLQSLLDEL